MLKAKHLKIPYGKVDHRVVSGGSWTRRTDGILIYRKDRPRWDAYIPKKER
jgi:hypothetical protein